VRWRANLSLSRRTALVSLFDYLADLPQYRPALNDDRLLGWGEWRHEFLCHPVDQRRRSFQKRYAGRKQVKNMAGHGWDRKAPGYRRSPASDHQDLAWVFDGIIDEVIGDFGLIMNGTAGDEIDRVDYRYGTPSKHHRSCIIGTAQ
jgi:hypothetical protein